MVEKIMAAAVAVGGGAHSLGCRSRGAGRADGRLARGCSCEEGARPPPTHAAAALPARSTSPARHQGRDHH